MITHRLLIQQIEAMEPAIRDAFLRSVADIVGAANVTTLTRMIQQGRFEEILAAIDLTEAELSAVTEAVRNAYVAGGAAGALEIAGNRQAVRFRFNVRNPRAEAWLREHSSRLVTHLLAEQLEAVREAVSAGTVAGRNPRQTALDIVGRIDRQTGRRRGGIVGLSAPQARYVASARAQLTSGNPEAMRAYLTRARRDRRFDGLVNRAIAAGRPVAAGDVERIVGRYADRLLQRRGEDIARTEAMAAFNTARDEAYEQLVESGRVKADNVLKAWSAVGDGRTRDAHAAMSGQRRAIGAPFQSPTGAQLMFPGDSSLGAGAGDIANCRCTSQYRVDFIAEAAARG